ncbi:uncharacterized protein DSM5745_08532 [Aspergillus mulundensis]|uniref:Uncharacterized protein n=1 Tax=Aspergillus mulundensis TaxID=1810919 RepID=A0A3D8R3Y5_9EURO|nr:hypothetical protein DSM5745_08532 [Aspergillus mulundensis]RDW68772.1 hypothetical protein DSM5745_08532 [Aspergillus mulundensis]
MEPERTSTPLYQKGKKNRLSMSLDTESTEMISKEEAIRICKEHGISEQDARAEFEKIDIDNDDEMPRNITSKIVDNLSNKLK